MVYLRLRGIKRPLREDLRPADPSSKLAFVQTKASSRSEGEHPSMPRATPPMPARAPMVVLVTMLVPPRHLHDDRLARHSARLVPRLRAVLHPTAAKASAQTVAWVHPHAHPRLPHHSWLHAAHAGLHPHAAVL